MATENLKQLTPQEIASFRSKYTYGLFLLIPFVFVLFFGGWWITYKFFNDRKHNVTIMISIILIIMFLYTYKIFDWRKQYMKAQLDGL